MGGEEAEEAEIVEDVSPSDQELAISLIEQYKTEVVALQDEVRSLNEDNQPLRSGAELHGRKYSSEL